MEGTKPPALRSSVEQWTALEMIAANEDIAHMAKGDENNTTILTPLLEANLRLSDFVMRWMVNIIIPILTLPFKFVTEKSLEIKINNEVKDRISKEKDHRIALGFKEKLEEDSDFL